MSRSGFSTGWVWMSLAFFTVVEVVMGGLVAPVLSGRFFSHVAMLRLEVVVILASYFAGAFAIGLISPSVRVIEPAVGAALSAMMPFLIGVFSPVRFFHLGGTSPWIAAAIAFFVAMAGADTGERFAARMGNSSSRRYTGPED